MSISVSVIVCTRDRPEDLERALTSLSLLRRDEIRFEVIVVRDPSDKKTGAILHGWSDSVKVVDNPDANLSLSRNLGIRSAAGEFVGFIDDDAAALPWWLTDLAPTLRQSRPDVACISGEVFNPDGVSHQVIASAINEWGDSIPMHHFLPDRLLRSPFASLVVYAIGTNALYRRSALLSVGGFDEQIVYYLEDADIAMRLRAKGMRVRCHRRGSVVHHFSPSSYRSQDGTFRRRFQLLRNRLYFSLVHSTGTVAEREAKHCFFEASHRTDVAEAIRTNRLDSIDQQILEADIETARSAALDMADNGSQLRSESWFGTGDPFLALDGPGIRRRLTSDSESAEPNTFSLIRMPTDSLQLVDRTWVRECSSASILEEVRADLIATGCFV